MKRTNDQDRQALKRIMAMLLALADVAERASQRSLPIRLLVFWFLRPAEAYARNLVVEAARDLGYQAHLPPSSVEGIAPMLSGDGNRPCKVLRLALAFEMLAAALDDLATLISADRAPRSCGHATGRMISPKPPAARPSPSRPLRARRCIPFRAAVGYPDTS